MTYEDPVITKYFDLIKANTSAFREYYMGDPIRIPASMLPCVIISKAETRVGPLSNTEDEHGIQLILTVVTDVRKEIRDEKDIAPGTARLYELVEGRDATTLALNADSILHILRNNLLVDSANGLRTDLNTITRVEYGLTQDKRQEGAWSVEASLEFVAHYSQNR